VEGTKHARRLARARIEELYRSSHGGTAKKIHERTPRLPRRSFDTEPNRQGEIIAMMAMIKEKKLEKGAPGFSKQTWDHAAGEAFPSKPSRGARGHRGERKRTSKKRGKGILFLQILLERREKMK